MVSNIKLFCNLSLYFIIFVASEAAQVSFNEHSNGAGESIAITLDEDNCYNLPSAWNDRASQLITPYFMCLDVYEHSNCSGKVKHFPAGYAMFEELGGTEFNDLISSFKISSPGKNGCSSY